MARAAQSQSEAKVSNNASTKLSACLLLAFFLLLRPYAHAAIDTNPPPTGFPSTYTELALDEFAAITDLEELLEERRFRVEMIVFTRSNQTGLGEEPLLFIEPRTLPKNIFALMPSISAIQSASDAGKNPYCIGYPVIATEPKLPRKLRALLDKQNEPELAQWYLNGILPTELIAPPGQSDSLLGDGFSYLSENPQTAEGIDFDTSIEKTLSAAEQRSNELSVTDELFDNAGSKDNPVDPVVGLAIKLAIPDSSPRISPSPYLNFVSQLSLFDDAVKQGAYRALSPEGFELTKQASILKRNPKFNLVLHESWQQVVPPRAAPQQIYFSSGNSDNSDNSYNSIEGLVSVTLGRYLHFAGQLWLEAPVEDYQAEQLLSARGAAKVTAQTGLEQVLVEVESLAQTLREGAAANLVEAGLATAPRTAYFELNENRRMRSKALHYLDHPAMGIIVKITPVEAPAELAAAWTDFEEYRKVDEQKP